MAALDDLKARLPDADFTVLTDSVLMSILDSAKAAILARRYPFGYDPTTVTDVEAIYSDLKIRVAIDMVNRMGAEGQKTHSENSIQRQWEEGWVSESLLREVIPKAVIC